MIDRQAINVDCAANCPEEAIREAGEALCRAGACSPQYVQAMVDSYRELGPYFVIAPGLALPHARPEQGARKAQISAIRLHETAGVWSCGKRPGTGGAGVVGNQQRCAYPPYPAYRDRTQR